MDQFFNAAGSGDGGAGGPSTTVIMPGMPEGQPWGAPAVSSPSRSLSGSPRKSAGTPTRFGGTVWRQESLSGGVSGGGDAAGPAGGNPFGMQPSGGGAVHRRLASTASSSHQRTLSGGSIDIYGSMPGTPSRIEGPERTIAAGFKAEMEGELSVDPGDRVKVHSEVGGWARVLRVSDLRAGLVPSWAVGE